MQKKRNNSAPKPLNSTQLRDLALHYVARYATSCRKLEGYLQRKCRERGWDDPEIPDSEQFVAKILTDFTEKNYIDDRLYARNKARDLIMRGYGERRIKQSWFQAGIAPADQPDIHDLLVDASPLARNIDDGDDNTPPDARDIAAKKYARRRKIGPFAKHPDQWDDSDRHKQLQAMLRAGHDWERAKKWVWGNAASWLDNPESAPDDWGDNEGNIG